MQVRGSRRSSCRKFQADDSAVTEIAAVHLFHTTGNVRCTVTGQRYTSLLELSIIPAHEARRCGKTTIFMHVGAPLHIARCLKQLLRRYFGDERIFKRKFPTAWPPRFPDLNP